MSIVTKIKLFYLSMAIFCIMLVSVLFVIYEIDSKSDKRDLQLELAKKDISLDISSKIHKIKVGFPDGIYFSKYKNNQLLQEKTSLSKSKIAIEPIFKKINKGEIPAAYKTKAGTNWITVEHKNNENYYFGIIDLSMIASKFDENYKIKLSNSKSKINSPIISGGKLYPYKEILEHNGLFIGVYDTKNIISFIDIGFIRDLLATIISLFSIFFISFYYVIKAKILVPFVQFSKAVSSIDNDRTIPKKSISEKNFEELNKALCSIQNKVNLEKKLNDNAHNNIDSFVKIHKSINLTENSSSATYLSFMLTKREEKLLTSSTFLFDIKKAFRKIGIRLESILIVDSMVFLSFFDLKDNDYQSLDQIIKTEFLKSTSINLGKNYIARIFQFNPFRFDSMKAYEALHESTIMNVPFSIIDIKIYHKFLSLKESILKGEAIHKLTYQPIISKGKNIVAALVENNVYLNDKEIDKGFYYQCIKHQNNKGVLDSVIGQFSKIQNKLSMININPIEFYIDIDYQIFESEYFERNLDYIEDAKITNLSNLHFLLSKNQINSEDKVDLIISKGINVAIDQKELSIVNSDSLAKASSVLALVSNPESFNEIEMLAEFYKKKNTKVLLHGFKPNDLQDILSSKAASFFYADFIKPKMEINDFIDVISNEIKVISMTKK